MRYSLNAFLACFQVPSPPLNCEVLLYPFRSVWSTWSYMWLVAATHGFGILQTLVMMGIFLFFISPLLLCNYTWLTMPFKIFVTRMVPAPGTPAQPMMSGRDPDSKHMTRSLVFYIRPNVHLASSSPLLPPSWPRLLPLDVCTVLNLDHQDRKSYK